jgi:hypothetical protein
MTGVERRVTIGGLIRLACAVAVLVVLTAPAARASAARPAPTEIEHVRASMRGLACPSTNQCTAIDEGLEESTLETSHELTFDPSSPGAAQAIAVGSTDYADIACPSQTQCTALGASGSVVTFNPTSPASQITGTIESGLAVEALACPSVAQCTTVDKHGREVTFNPMSPASPTPVAIDPEQLTEAIACPSASQCTAVDTSGRAVTFDPQSPEAPTTSTIDPSYQLTHIACPSLTQCTAVDRDGNEITFNPTSPGAVTLTALKRGAGPVVGYPTEGIACPSTTQCTAALEVSPLSSGVVTFNPNSPGTPTPVSILETISSISCPSSSQCTINDDVQVLTFDPTMLGATATPAWTHAQCKRTYTSWLRRHSRARRSARSAEASLLRRQHGCPSSSL